MDLLLDVTRVEVTSSYVLSLEFENGEQRVFDMGPFMDRAPFTRLKDPRLFRQARVVNGTVGWPGDIDIAPETLYDASRPR
jgi:hypothetical protein